LWPGLLPSEDLRNTAYGLEATLQEMFLIVGPLITGVIAATAGPASAIAAAAALGCAGTLGLAVTAPSRRWRASGAVHRTLLGPLTVGGVRVVLSVALALGAAVGTLQVSFPAFASANGST